MHSQTFARAAFLAAVTIPFNSMAGAAPAVIAKHAAQQTGFSSGAASRHDELGRTLSSSRVLPSGPELGVTPAGAPQDDGGLAGATVCGETTYTQSTAPTTIEAGGSIICAENDISTEFSHARAFTIDSAGLVVSCVSFGIEFNAGPAWPTRVRLLTGPVTGPYANLTLLSEAVVDIPANSGQAFHLAEFPEGVVVPGGGTLIVELNFPTRLIVQGGDGGTIVPGCNDDGQSGPTYVRADACGVPSFTDFAALGYPHVHVAMTVSGAVASGSYTQNYTYDYLTSTTLPMSSVVVGDVNTHGTVAFSVNAPASSLGVYVYSSGTSVKVIEPGPTYSAFGPPDINCGGQVAVRAQRPLGGGDDMLLYDGSSVPVLVYPGNGDTLSDPSINDHGDIVFVEVSSGELLHVATGSGFVQSPTTIASVSNPADDIMSFGPRTDINNVGEIAYGCNLASTPHTEVRKIGQFGAGSTCVIYSGSSAQKNLFSVAINGPGDVGGLKPSNYVVGNCGPLSTLVPNPGGIAFASPLDMNWHRGVSWQGQDAVGGTMEGGIYGGPNPLTDKILRVGQPFPPIPAKIVGANPNAGGTNNRGQVSFRSSMTDGTIVVGCASPAVMTAEPEPCPLDSDCDGDIVVTDAGFETNALIGYSAVLNNFPGFQGTWGAEDGTIVTGLTNGVAPFTGSKMLRMTNDGLTASQTVQVIDISSLAVLVDAGGLEAEFSAHFNAATGVAAASSQATIRYYSSNGLGGATTLASDSLILDADTSTWQPNGVTAAIPAGTRWMVVELAYGNASIGALAGFVDDAQLCIRKLPCDSDLTVTDAGFESSPLIGYSAALNNFAAFQGSWGAESGSIAIGTTGGVAPYSGSRMLSMTNDGLTASQTVQVIDISTLATLIDTGSLEATFSAYFNGATGIAAASSLTTLRFYSTSGLGGASTVTSHSLVLDANTGTWQLNGVTAAIPIGTRWMVVELAYGNASIGSLAGFVDEAALCIHKLPCDSALGTTDSAFETSPLLDYATVLNDFVLYQGSWGGESGSIVTGLSDGVAPHSGSKMLRMTDDGLTVSQTVQVIDLTTLAAVIDANMLEASFCAQFNAATGVAAASAQTTLRCYNTSGLAGATIVASTSLVLDASTSTWQLNGVTTLLPTGTRWIVVELAYSNASIGPLAGFVDDAELCLREVGQTVVGDLDGDGIVNAGDLAILLGGWGGGGPADLDGDGIVNAGDLAVLLGGWGGTP